MIGLFIQKMSEHIEKTEKNLLHKGEGWESYLNHKVRFKILKITLMGIPSLIFWLFMIFFTYKFASSYDMLFSGNKTNPKSHISPKK
jgi:hypothetical protein